MSFYVSELFGPLANMAKRQAQQLRTAKIGYVTSYNPDTYTVRVRLEPESTVNEQVGVDNPVVETNWLPLYRAFGGKGWGLVTPPHADPNPPYGDMCLVLWPDNAHGVALVGFANDKETSYNGTTPSKATASTASKPHDGEFVLVHATGSWLKLTNDGSVQFRSSSGSTCTFDKNGQMIGTSSTGAKFQFDSSGNVDIEDGSGNYLKIGSGSANDGIVTKQHLANVLLTVNQNFTLKQNSSSQSPGTAVAEASTTVFAKS